MQNQRQGVQSTKFRSSQLPMQQRSEATLRPEEKQRDVFLPIYKPKETFYINQTGKFPHWSSRGNWYHMILHKLMDILPVFRQDLIVKDLVFWYNPTLSISLRWANIISTSVLFFMVSIQVDIHQFV